MAPLRNPLVGDLLDLAEEVARQPGRSSFRQAILRRTVSTAYYALSHALCTVYSDGLVRWSRTDLVDRTYRALDHGNARRKLAALASAAVPSAPIRRVSGFLNVLQDNRNDADYERPRVLFSRIEVEILIGDARDAIDLLAAMDEDARRRLAIDLLAARAR